MCAKLKGEVSYPLVVVPRVSTYRCITMAFYNTTLKVFTSLSLLVAVTATYVPETRQDFDVLHHTRRYPTYHFIGDPFPIIDQGNLGSCTAVSVSYLLNYEGYKYDYKIDSSIMFMYYNARSNPRYDTGSTIGNIFEGVYAYGYSSNNCWPYDMNYWRTKPDPWCYKTKSVDVLAKHLELRLDSVRWAINQNQPLAMGFDIDDATFTRVSFDGVLDTEIDEYINTWSGHAVVVLGYNDEDETLFIRNSWGKHWSQYNGYFYMSYDYFKENADSLWIARV